MAFGHGCTDAPKMGASVRAAVAVGRASEQVLQLRDLLKQVGVEASTGDMGVLVRGVAYDSRAVEPGYLFVCIRGERHDGHDFAEEAVRRGAVALVVEKDVTVAEGVAAVRVRDSREALARVAQAFYGDPSRSMVCVGVTGTKGKTTTTHLVKHVLDASGKWCGIIGTIGHVVGDEVIESKHTTPESLDVQRILAEMRKRGQRAAAMEVSSHAVVQGRVLGVDFDIGVFTNIGHDHLDFHGTFESYLAAKTSFFEALDRGPSPKGITRTAVINLDQAHARHIISRTRAHVMTYGISSAADVRAEDVRLLKQGASFTVNTPKGRADVRLKLSGVFNVYNALAAIACGVAAGASPEEAKSGVESVVGVPGRFETVDEGQPFVVIVDFAHTPDSLENVLRAARGLAMGEMTVVFGCGGDRDRTKRPIMGEIAARLANHVIITSDNPRSEDPESICREIEDGVLRVRRPLEGYEVIVGRADAIRRALFRAKEGDVVVIAGKGHETYQIFRDRAIHFDDREIARDCLRERMASAEV
ncbi:MAG: UDP-N-acetylmuramoyl-L-alanyl-D-glutamate--2,6-diaminopimelate ligase [Firmicutes bacterium]|nr:UDP-N-acetylmuramoyl-L-alanyl-D-glutamate--2,6-diaminopimelate ligase [Bacillota bacterium]MDH7496411.1 UDP-N-acetylmuramoyl-L-alanyl-D-glutamate--2,6-diaminopimelate ligase [Bacillota bacterium]